MNLAATAGSVLGGIGLLLVGMTMMTDGLKLAAGNALRNILAVWTNTRLRGLGAGFLITGLVQSSSAVTVAAIGFANAGLLNLSQAVWVIYGSNVGTTMTGWIVALVGFKLKVEAFALPMIGLGVVLRLTGEATRRAYLGQAFIGFGLLFLGIGVLASTFSSVGESTVLPTMAGNWLWSVLVYVGLGMLLTTLMQSSSAAMVIALSAAEGGLVPLNTAALVVIGANLGTTTTAILAVWGATSTAKRVALSHVVFNLLTAGVAVMIVTPLLALVAFIRSSLNLEPSPAVTLALFHTTFNLLGVLLMWPVSSRIVHFLASRFQTVDELESRPRYLDKTVLALPHIAAQALTREVARIRTMALDALRQALAGAQPGRGRARSPHAVAQSLANAVGAYCAELSRTALPPDIAESLPPLMRATQQFTAILPSIDELSALEASFGTVRHEPVALALAEFRRSATQLVDELSADVTGAVTQVPAAALKSMETHYQALKSLALSAGSSGQLPVATMDAVLRYSAGLRRVVRQTRKAGNRLASVQATLSLDAAGQVVTDPEVNAVDDLEKAA